MVCKSAEALGFALGLPPLVAAIHNLGMRDKKRFAYYYAGSNSLPGNPAALRRLNSARLDSK